MHGPEIVRARLQPGAAIQDCPECGQQLPLRSAVICDRCGAEIELVQRYVVDRDE